MLSFVVRRSFSAFFILRDDIYLLIVVPVFFLNKWLAIDSLQ